jgi:hypothetical protein
MIHPRHIRLAAQLRREVVDREAALYGRRWREVAFLRTRGFAIHVETTSAGRRFRVDHRLLTVDELRLLAAREHRLLKHHLHHRKGN